MLKIYALTVIALSLCVSRLYAADDGFVASAEEIARRYHVTLVMEDSPVFSPSGEDKQSSDAVKSIASATTMDEAVKIFAQHFDYTPQRKGAIIEFRKLFTRQEDLPCVTQGELKAALEDALTVVDQFDPKYNLSRDPRAKSLMISLLSLSAEKLASGIPISEFDQSIRSQLLNVCLFFYLQPSSDCIKGAIQQLKIFSDKQTSFGKFTYKQYPVFGYKGIVANNESSVTVSAPLSMPQRFQWQGNSQLITQTTQSASTDGFSTSDNADDANTKDATEPDAAVKATPTKTLQEAFEILDRRRTPDAERRTKSTPRYQIMSFLANKRVSLFGLDYAAPDDIVSSIAAVYGLRVVKQGTPVTTLSVQRPRFRPANDALQLNKSLLALIPAPMARKIHAFDETPTTAKPTTAPQATISLTTNGVETSWRTVAVKKLRSLVEPMAKKKEAGMLLQSEFTGDADVALANVVMAGMYQGFYLFCRPAAPLYLTQFDDLIVGGRRVKRDDGVNRFAVRFSLRQPDGTIVPAAVFSVNTDFMGLTTKDAPP